MDQASFGDMNNLDGLNQISNLSPESVFKEESLTRQVIRWISRLFLVFVAATMLAVLLLRWINPPTSSYMVQRQIEAWWNENDIALQYQWTDWENISTPIKVAAITSEDQNFANHWGLDISSIRKAINEYERGEDLRGASTITQQVAKNLFLWSDKSYIRKGIEAYFALIIELLWSKERILEVYLNIAEFGDGIYGVQAAAQHYFDTTAASLSKWQSSLMVTALPAPKRYNLANPSQYMLQRRTWVLRYMDFLGNSHYLNQLK